ncbi:MAG: hypothetical protein O3B13_22405 [Planctomycetota bacterium]|nr:hypothetical protein [Planctomycetota bacterium]MDA1165861.1 hypothetical protein [Planctomycetota bacterium]
MNQNIHSDPLDNMLQQWGDERAADTEHLDNLQERIVLALGNEELASTDSVANGPVDFRTLPGTRRASVAGFLVGVTLTALLAFVWITQLADQGDHKPRITRAPQIDMPAYARLNEDELRSRIVLLSEMKDLFGDRLNWLAETEARIEVGLSDRRTLNDESVTGVDAVQLAVRVVVEKRASADSDWQLALCVDVMSRSEEVVEIAPATGDGTSMTFWVYALPDGMVAMDSELSFSNNDATRTETSSSGTGAFHAAFSHVQQDRLPSEELLTGSDGVEYRVFQTVAVLDKKVG